MAASLSLASVARRAAGTRLKRHFARLRPLSDDDVMSLIAVAQNGTIWHRLWCAAGSAPTTLEHHCSTAGAPADTRCGPWPSVVKGEECATDFGKASARTVIELEVNESDSAWT